MVPGAVLAEVAEEWLRSFPVREEGLVVLAAATDMPVDSWRKRLSFGTSPNRTGTVHKRGWFGREYVEDDKVDEFLTAAGLTHLWHTPPLNEFLPEPTPEDEDFHATCVDCGTFIDWREPGAGVSIEIGQMVNVRRRYRWFSLCPVCASYRLPLPAQKPDAAGKLTRKIPNKAVHDAYLVYVRQGIGMKLIAEGIYQRYGYSSAGSCMSSLYQQWEKAGWPMRRREQSRKSNTRNGHTKRRVSSRISEQTLRKAYELHMRHNMSCNELGRRLYEKLGYKNHHSCAVAISAGWKQMGLKARDRIEMTVLATRKDGLSPRDWKERRKLRLEAGLTCKGKKRQARCTETVKSGKRKGERCGRPAITGKHHCPAHDPASDERRREFLRRMRANSPRHSKEHTVAVGVVLPDLEAYYATFGTWKPLAEATGLDGAVLSRNRKRQPDERMTLETYRKLRTGLDRLMPAELPLAA